MALSIHADTHSEDTLSGVQCMECDWTGPFDVDGMHAVFCGQCGAELEPDVLAVSEDWDTFAPYAAGDTGQVPYLKRAIRLVLRAASAGLLG